MHSEIVLLTKWRWTKRVTNNNILTISSSFFNFKDIFPIPSESLIFMLKMLPNFPDNSKIAIAW